MSSVACQTRKVSGSRFIFQYKENNLFNISIALSSFSVVVIWVSCIDISFAISNNIIKLDLPCVGLSSCILFISELVERFIYKNSQSKSVSFSIIYKDASQE